MRLKFVFRKVLACGLVLTAVQFLRQKDVQSHQRFSDLDVTIRRELAVHLVSFSRTLLEPGTNRWFPFRVILCVGTDPSRIPKINPLADFFLCLPITLFDGPVKLVLIAFYMQEIILREFSPMLFDMSLKLLPTRLELLFIHDALLLYAQTTTVPRHFQANLSNTVTRSALGAAETGKSIAQGRIRKRDG